MLHFTQGVVLRVRPLTETSLIIHWLTNEFGRIAVVAKGARRDKSPFRGKLDLFYEGELGFRRSRTSELHALTEVTLHGTHPELRANYDLLQQACYAVELLELTTESETPLPEQYELLTGFLSYLSRSSAAESKNVLALELKLLSLSGLMPVVEEATLTPGARRIAKLFSEGEWTSLAPLRLAPEQESELARFAFAQFDALWPRPPKTRASALRAGKPDFALPGS